MRIISYIQIKVDCLIGKFFDGELVDLDILDEYFEIEGFDPKEIVKTEVTVRPFKRQYQFGIGEAIRKDSHLVGTSHGWLSIIFGSSIYYVNSVYRQHTKEPNEYTSKVIGVMKKLQIPSSEEVPVKESVM